MYSSSESISSDSEFNSTETSYAGADNPECENSLVYKQLQQKMDYIMQVWKEKQKILIKLKEQIQDGKDTEQRNDSAMLSIIKNIEEMQISNNDQSKELEKKQRELSEIEVEIHEYDRKVEKLTVKITKWEQRIFEIKQIIACQIEDEIEKKEAAIQADNQKLESEIKKMGYELKQIQNNIDVEKDCQLNLQLRNSKLTEEYEQLENQLEQTRNQVKDIEQNQIFSLKQKSIKLKTKIQEIINYYEGWVKQLSEALTECMEQRRLKMMEQNNVGRTEQIVIKKKKKRRRSESSECDQILQEQQCQQQFIEFTTVPVQCDFVEEQIQNITTTQIKTKNKSKSKLNNRHRLKTVKEELAAMGVQRPPKKIYKKNIIKKNKSKIKEICHELQLKEAEKSCLKPKQHKHDYKELKKHVLDQQCRNLEYEKKELQCKLKEMDKYQKRDTIHHEALQIQKEKINLLNSKKQRVQLVEVDQNKKQEERPPRIIYLKDQSFKLQGAPEFNAYEMSQPHLATYYSSMSTLPVNHYSPGNTNITIKKKIKEKKAKKAEFEKQQKIQKKFKKEKKEQQYSPPEQDINTLLKHQQKQLAEVPKQLINPEIEDCYNQLTISCPCCVYCKKVEQIRAKINNIYLKIAKQNKQIQELDEELNEIESGNCQAKMEHQFLSEQKQQLELQQVLIKKDGRQIKDQKKCLEGFILQFEKRIQKLKKIIAKLKEEYEILKSGDFNEEINEEFLNLNHDSKFEKKKLKSQQKQLENSIKDAKSYLLELKKTTDQLNFQIKETNCKFTGIKSNYSTIKSHYDILMTETLPTLQRKLKKKKCKIRAKGVQIKEYYEQRIKELKQKLEFCCECPFKQQQQHEEHAIEQPIQQPMPQQAPQPEYQLQLRERITTQYQPVVHTTIRKRPDPCCNQTSIPTYQQPLSEPVFTGFQQPYGMSGSVVSQPPPLLQQQFGYDAPVGGYQSQQQGFFPGSILSPTPMISNGSMQYF